MERCISDIRAWMTNNYLKLNDTKTEFLVIGSRQQLTKIKIDSIRVGPTEIQKVSSVRNLGAWFDTFMTMTTHIGKACSKGFFGLVQNKANQKVPIRKGYCYTYSRFRYFTSGLLLLTFV